MDNDKENITNGVAFCILRDFWTLAHCFEYILMRSQADLKNMSQFAGILKKTKTHPQKTASSYIPRHANSSFPELLFWFKRKQRKTVLKQSKMESVKWNVCSEKITLVQSNLDLKTLCGSFLDWKLACETVWIGPITLAPHRFKTLTQELSSAFVYKLRHYVN